MSVIRQDRGTHLILYDGVCGLCTWLNQFVLQHDARGIFSFASLQSEIARQVLGRFGKNPEDLDTFYVVANFKSDAPIFYDRSRAALFVAGALGSPWRFLRFAGILPASLLDTGYRWVARNRYRIFGRHDRCLVPSAEYANRFIDNSLR